MSDLHGCYDELNQMFTKISFSSVYDTMVIAGDYIDRGSQSFEMLQWLSSRPKGVVFLMGNHDLEFINYIELMNHAGKQYMSRVYEMNSRNTKTLVNLIDQSPLGGIFDYYGTIHELVKKYSVTLGLLNEWKNIISAFPPIYKTVVNGVEHIIVHAGYTKKDEVAGMSREEFYLYAREEAYTKGGKKDCVIIAGHTPTLIEDEMVYNEGKIFKYYDERRNCTFYDIDCGAVYKKHLRSKVACLRLEDKKEFYV